MKLNGTMWYDFMIWSEANKVWWVRFLKTKDCDKKLLNSLQTHNIYFTSILLWFICLCGVFDGCGGWPTTSYLCQLCWPVGTTYMYNPPMHYNLHHFMYCNNHKQIYKSFLSASFIRQTVTENTRIGPQVIFLWPWSGVDGAVVELLYFPIVAPTDKPLTVWN